MPPRIILMSDGNILDPHERLRIDEMFKQRAKVHCDVSALQAPASAKTRNVEAVKTIEESLRLASVLNSKVDVYALMKASLGEPVLTEAERIERLAGKETIFVSGGSPDYLAWNYEAFPQYWAQVRQLVLDGALCYIGQSAGSIFAGACLHMNRLQPKHWAQGLGLQGRVVCPHAGVPEYRMHLELISEQFGADSMLQISDGHYWDSERTVEAEEARREAEGLADEFERQAAAGAGGMTPLHLAFEGFVFSRATEYAVGVLLLRHPGDVNVANQAEGGETPLLYACRRSDETVVRVMLQHGASVQQASHDGQTPLHRASEMGRDRVVRDLLIYRASVDHASQDGQTALHRACQMGRAQVVRDLLDHGASVNHASHDGQTALHRAGVSGEEAVARTLLEHRANIDQADQHGQTPLYRASLGARVVARLLLQRRANVHQADQNTWTPLLAASFQGHVSVMQELLQHGASANQASVPGRTPLGIARRQGHREAETLLRQAGARLGWSEWLRLL